MNNFFEKPLSLFILLMVLMSGIALTSCSDENDSGNGTNVTASDLSGHGFSSTDDPMTISGFDSDYYYETLYFKDSSTVNWQWWYDNEYGVMADGTYTVENNVITIEFSRLGVYGVSGSNSFGGFTNGQSYTLRYTINKYEYPNLTLTNSNGKKQLFEAYR